MPRLEINGSDLIITLRKNQSVKNTSQYTICKGKARKNYTLIIPNYLSENEQKGFLAEQKFAQFLDKRNISYLYIGQLASSLSFSKVFKDEGIRRPDYLICHPDFGNILIDVKSRTQFIERFDITYREYCGLLKAQCAVNIPVWIALTDAAQLQEEVIPKFHFISVDKINRFLDRKFIFSNYSNYLQEDKITIYKDILINEEDFFVVPPENT